MYEKYNNNNNYSRPNATGRILTTSSSSPVRASSPTLWEELFYKELPVQPIPSHPALLHEDTTFWNEVDHVNRHVAELDPSPDNRSRRLDRLDCSIVLWNFCCRIATLRTFQNCYKSCTNEAILNDCDVFLHTAKFVNCLNSLEIMIHVEHNYEILMNLKNQ